jgi:hypothetical protein
VVCSSRNDDDNFGWALVSRAVVCSLWVCLHVNWCYLGMIGASRGVGGFYLQICLPTVKNAPFSLIGFFQIFSNFPRSRCLRRLCKIDTLSLILPRSCLSLSSEGYRCFSWIKLGFLFSSGGTCGRCSLSVRWSVGFWWKLNPFPFRRIQASRYFVWRKRERDSVGLFLWGSSARTG